MKARRLKILKGLNVRGGRINRDPGIDQLRKNRHWWKKEEPGGEGTKILHVSKPFCGGS